MDNPLIIRLVAEREQLRRDLEEARRRAILLEAALADMTRARDALTVALAQAKREAADARGGAAVLANALEGRESGR